jgi:adenylyltransferase/sulfurtransferase
MAFTVDEKARYSRHLILPEIGERGQERLKSARVLVVGAGGLGSPCSLYLAAAGVGTIGILDSDNLELSNLQRQVVHSVHRIGKPKADSAAARLLSINPEIRIIPHRERLTAANAAALMSPYDIVVDGSDNFPTRYLVGDACYLFKKPLVYGAVLRFSGQASVFIPDLGPCYRCLFPVPPGPETVPSCSEAGVLGTVPGLIGVVQATEAIKLILGRGVSLQGRVLVYDALGLKFNEIKLEKDPDCPLCGRNPSIRDLGVYGEACSERADELSVRDLKKLLDAGRRPVLVDVREPVEWEKNRLPGAVFIRLEELGDRAGELDRNAETVVYCYRGVRSATAVKTLIKLGFGKVRNLAGGIDAWVREVDPSCPRY